MAIIESPANRVGAVDYFKAKLQFECYPGTLHGLLGLPTLLILDVRGREAFARDHIPGALNVPLDELHKRHGELPQGKTIICCSGGPECPKAARAALELAHLGYAVQELIGGMESWKKAGFELETEERGRFKA